MFVTTLHRQKNQLGEKPEPETYNKRVKQKLDSIDLNDNMSIIPY